MRYKGKSEKQRGEFKGFSCFKQCLRGGGTNHGSDEMGKEDVGFVLPGAYFSMGVEGGRGDEGRRLECSKVLGAQDKLPCAG